MRKRKKQKDELYVMNIGIISKYNSDIILRNLEKVELNPLLSQTKNNIIFEGTIYSKINLNNLVKLRSKRYDQVIVDYRDFKLHEINHILSIVLSNSCVPTDFQIINANDILPMDYQYYGL